MNPVLSKSFDKGATIAPYRIVKFSAEATVVQATGSTNALIGVSNNLGSTDDGRCEVQLMGLVEVEYGASVTQGQWLTSDADGKAVPAAPALNINAQVIGRAYVPGDDGDIGLTLLSPCVVQGEDD